MTSERANALDFDAWAWPPKTVAWTGSRLCHVGGVEDSVFLTVVGCFLSHGTPAMLGDFLITRSGEAPSVRKKLRRLSPNVAVGWTGSLFDAGRVFQVLVPRLAQRADSEEVEEVLSGLDTSSLTAPLTLVGWVVDQQPDAFMWQSSLPSEVHWGGPWHVGSGGQVLDQIVGEEGFRTADASEQNAP